MKGKKRKGAVVVNPAEMASDFTRGAIATGLLAAIQGRWDGTGGTGSPAKVLRLSLQGGAALAAGAAAATSLRNRNYLAALASVAGGVAGIAAIEMLMAPTAPDDEQEISRG